MIDNTSLTIIGGLILAMWNGYIHTKLAKICNNCVYTYKPKKKFTIKI